MPATSQTEVPATFQVLFDTRRKNLIKENEQEEVPELDSAWLEETEEQEQDLRRRFQNRV